MFSGWLNLLAGVGAPACVGVFTNTTTQLRLCWCFHQHNYPNSALPLTLHNGSENPISFLAIHKNLYLKFSA